MQLNDQKNQLIERKIKQLSILKTQIQIANQKINFYQQFNEHIKVSLKSIQQFGQKKFANPNMRIKKTIMSLVSKKKQEQLAIYSPSQCKISKHLQQILGKEVQKQQIQRLKSIQKSIYLKIKNILEKQEPYICQSMMMRIQKSAKHQIKLKVISQLGNYIKKHKDWLVENKKQIQEQALKKKIQDLTVLNLQKMKQIMNTKININQYLFSILENNQLEKVYTQQIENIKDKIKQKFISNVESLEDYNRQIMVSIHEFNKPKINNFNCLNSFQKIQQEIKQSFENYQKDQIEKFQYRCKCIEQKIESLEQKI